MEAESDSTGEEHNGIKGLGSVGFGQRLWQPVNMAVWEKAPVQYDATTGPRSKFSAHKSAGNSTPRIGQECKQLATSLGMMPGHVPSGNGTAERYHNACKKCCTGTKPVFESGQDSGKGKGGKLIGPI